METVLITGATEGIGFEFVRLFAARGCALVLVARNGEKLAEIAGEFGKMGTGVRVRALDLSVEDNVQQLCRWVKEEGIRVDYLVNNAGFGIDARYVDTGWEKESVMLRLNMMAVACLTKFFAADMLSRGAGRILNVASIAAFQPGPYMAGYCATKAFVLSLSQAVNYELKGSGVTVSALCPGVTDSRFHEVAGTEKVGMSEFLPHSSSARVAAYGMKLMMKGRAVGVEGWINRLVVFSNRLVCHSWSVAVSARMLRKS